MSKLGDALKRKWGPLPAWGWLVFLVGIVYYYRHYMSTSSAVSGTGTGSVAPAPVTPQPITTLQPGETAYDPNTGGFLTAPGGGATTDTTSGTGSDNSAATAIDDLATAITAAMQAGPGTTGPAPGAPGGTTTGRSTPPSQRMSTLTASERRRGFRALPFGPRKPRTKPPRGFRVIGEGHGNWVLAPIKAAGRVVKTKPSTQRASKTRTPASQRRRSTTSVRGTTHQRSTGSPTTPARNRQSAPPPPPARRNQTRTPTVSAPPQQQHEVRKPAPKPATRRPNPRRK